MPSSTHRRGSLKQAEGAIAMGAGALLLLGGTSSRPTPLVKACLAISSVPLLYRGITGHWPLLPDGADTRTALGGPRGIHVHESVRLERPIRDVYRYWRRLEHLPRFMSHLERVVEADDRRSHWVARGPAGLGVEWDAEIINEVEPQVIGWRSLPGSDVVTAGSVNFDSVRGGRGTQVTVRLQYALPAGKVSALMAQLFGLEPSQTIREDLRRFKQILEAGEAPRAAAQS